MSDGDTGEKVPLGWVRYHWLATALVGVFSATSTVWLNLSNDHLKARLDEAALQLKKQEQEFDQRLRDRASALEESRERVARYDFVSRTLSTVDPTEDGYKLTLAVNIVRLALSPEEQTGLFANLELASDSKTREVGKVGREMIRQSRVTSKKLQNDGFEAVSKGELEQARDLFQKAEAQAPGEGVAYEMGRLLKKGSGSGETTEKNVLQQVKNNYIQYVPEETRKALKERAQALEANP